MHYQPSPCAAPLLRPALSATPIALAAAAMVLALATPALHAQPTAAPTREEAPVTADLPGVLEAYCNRNQSLVTQVRHASDTIAHGDNTYASAV